MTTNRPGPHRSSKTGKKTEAGGNVSARGRANQGATACDLVKNGGRKGNRGKPNQRARIWAGRGSLSLPSPFIFLGMSGPTLISQNETHQTTTQHPDPRREDPHPAAVGNVLTIQPRNMKISNTTGPPHSAQTNWHNTLRTQKRNGTHTAVATAFGVDK